MIVLNMEGGKRPRTIMIGRRGELPVVGNTIISGDKEERGNEDDVCVFIDIQYGEEDIGELKEYLKNCGLEFDDIILFCG